MTDTPDDNDSRENENENDDEGNDQGQINKGNVGQPRGPVKRKLKILMSQSAQEVKFADMFGFTLTPSHAIVKFGVMQPETGEFVVHTQIALTPQGMMAFGQAIQKNLQKLKKPKHGKGPIMN